MQIQPQPVNHSGNRCCYGLFKSSMFAASSTTNVGVMAVFAHFSVRDVSSSISPNRLCGLCGCSVVMDGVVLALPLRWRHEFYRYVGFLVIVISSPSDKTLHPIIQLPGMEPVEVVMSILAPVFLLCAGERPSDIC